MARSNVALFEQFLRHQLNSCLFMCLCVAFMQLYYNSFLDTDMNTNLNPGHKAWVQIDLQEDIRISSIELLKFNCKFSPSVSFCDTTMTYYVFATYTIL